MSTAVDIFVAGVSTAHVINLLVNRLGLPTGDAPDLGGGWQSRLLDMDVGVWSHDFADHDDIAFHRYPVCVEFRRGAGRYLLAHHQLRIMLAVARAVGSFLAREFRTEAIIVFDLQEKVATIDATGNVTELLVSDDGLVAPHLP